MTHKIKTVLGKLIIGHMLGFLGMTLFVGIVLVAVIIGITGLLSFVFWQLPTGVNLENSLMALRVCFGVGAVVGILFTCSKEGREFAKEIVSK